MIARWLGLILALTAGISNGMAADRIDSHRATDTAQVFSHQVLVMLRQPAPHFRPDVSYGGDYKDDISRSARRRLAEELARVHDLKVIDDWPMPALNIDCYVMEKTDNRPTDSIVDVLSRDPRVEWVQSINLFYAQAGHDPLYAVQPAAKYWQLSEIRKVATGRKVLVAVVDSGVEDRHPDLDGQISIKENFVDGNPYIAETHGTGVAGVIAAHAGNGIGIEGVAPDAHLMALRACWQEPDGTTRCNSFTLGKAINFAIMHGAQVINLSLSGPSDRLLQQLLDLAFARGIKVVGAVDPRSNDGGFPASYPGVFAVSDEKSKVPGMRTLLAPGHDVPTTAPGAGWSFVSGTSYSAAHISGMMALLVELQPSVKPSQIRENLVISPDSHVDAQADGVIDLCGTIARVIGKCTCTCVIAETSKTVH